MRTLSPDTPPDVEARLVEAYRRMSPRQKLRQVRDLTRAAQQMALARLRRQYPDDDARQQRLRLAALWLDRETMVRVFSWDPEVEGY